MKHDLRANSAIVSRLGGAVLLAGTLSLQCFPAGEPLPVEATFAHGAQQPSQVPVLPGLNVGQQVFYGPLVGAPAPGQGYQPADGDSFAIHNGKGVHNFILTTGNWWLRVGDRPRLHLELRTAAGAYAQPALLPDLGVSGQLRLRVTVGEKTKWLDEFDSIDALLSPGSVRWTCQDQDLGLTVRLEAQPLLRPWGFAATAAVSAAQPRTVTLVWSFDKANHVADHADYAEFATGKYTQLFVGLTEPRGRVNRGAVTVELSAGPLEPPDTCRYLCVWGYRDYDREAVAEAYKRLEFRPFDARWLEEMKPKWFDHWIGGGLEPEKKFLDARARHQEVVQDAATFWDTQRNRLQIRTPDARFDTVVNHVAAHARVQFEYPAFIHGLGYCKYGKINHGYYGFDAAGMHEEVADSLHFVAGTQDVKGRQRYFMTTFAISDWHEDMDFYFTEQCWWHWRWTGDNDFLRRIWPAVRRALEHGLTVSDPDGDNLMTGYYEMWDSDQNNTGGYSALQTAMAWAALRAAHEMAAALNDRDHSGKHGAGRALDPDYARRYRQRGEQVAEQYLRRLWQQDVGAWSSAEVNGLNRPRPHTCEQNYAIWRGLGDPMRNYMAMRYVRENLHRRDLLPRSTFEFINDWWPIQWSHHYVASGDTCASIHSACSAGDVDGFWDALQTIVESAYLHNGAVWQGTGSHAMEMEPLFLAALVDGLFGVKPYFGSNLLVLRPALPRAWDEVEFNHVDVRYHYRESNEGIVLTVTTPVPRRVRAELPVRWAVSKTTVNGDAAQPEFEPAVNAARVRLESPLGIEHHFVIERARGRPTIEGEKRGVLGTAMVFVADQVRVVKVHDPQAAMADVQIGTPQSQRTEVTFVPVRPGKPTVFLELQAGNATWYEPLDLSVQPPWRIPERYLPGLHRGGPTLLSPHLDPTNRTLTVELANGTAADLAGQAQITIAGKGFECEVNIAPHGTQSLDLSVAEIWDRLTPGTTPIQIEFAGRRETNAAVCWNLSPAPATWIERLRPLALNQHYNADMDQLFSPRTEWRIDYTGAQHGVDWRHPPPPRDERGWVLRNSVLSLFEWGVLPEQALSIKRVKFSSDLPDFGAPLNLSFVTVPNRILAVCCTQPYEQFPSRVSLKLPEPRRAAKLYLLTANIAKTLKCYYPAAEIVFHYAGGGETQLEQLIPPYSFPSLVSSICPRAQAIRVGQ
ncbi:MAG: hypothetical protein HY674_08100, partial [Chloroflexi bacterium]|nr:hypothetical protein [Chloroflexota bacterium]